MYVTGANDHALRLRLSLKIDGNSEERCIMGFVWGHGYWSVTAVNTNTWADEIKFMNETLKRGLIIK